MSSWHIVLGDRHEARKACFRREQVVIAAIELLIADAESNREEVFLPVVQESKLHRHDQVMAARGAAMQGCFQFAGAIDGTL